MHAAATRRGARCHAGVLRGHRDLLR